MTTAVGERIATRVGAPAELLDVCDAVTMQHCLYRHMYRLADAGRMPRPLKLGALVRWRRADLLEWITAGCRPVRGGTAMHS